MRGLTIVGAMLALGLAACNDEQNVADANAAEAASTPIKTVQATASQEHFYQCGGNHVQFTVLENGKADMRIAHTSFAMEQVAGGTGVKYENLGNPGTYVLNHNGKVLVAINGQNLPDCVEEEKSVEATVYRMQGNEPQWQGVVEKGYITLTLDAQGRQVKLPVMADAKTQEGRIITAQEAGDTVKVNILPQACTDSMSGEPFSHKVQVEYNGAAYAGCGQSLIRDTAFELDSIAGTPVMAGSAITLTFGSDGRLAGNSGCNLYGGSYTLEGEALHIHPDLISTMRACVDEGMMQQEHHFLQALPQMTAARLEGEGRLALSGAETSLIFHRK